MVDGDDEHSGRDRDEEYGDLLVAIAAEGGIVVPHLRGSKEMIFYVFMNIWLGFGNFN